MATETVKIAISLPKEKYQAVEKMRKKIRKTRSALISEALSLWLKEMRKEELIKRYIAGYKQHPESKAESKGASATSAQTLAAQEWEE